MSSPVEKAAPDLTPPKRVADEAARGLRLRERFARGGTEVGLERGRQLAQRRRLTPEIVQKMRAYFARHEVDKKAPKFDDRKDPSAGRIAWLLWGGDSGRAWAERMMKRLGR